MFPGGPSYHPPPVGSGHSSPEVSASPRPPSTIRSRRPSERTRVTNVCLWIFRFGSIHPSPFKDRIAFRDGHDSSTVVPGVVDRQGYDTTRHTDMVVVEDTQGSLDDTTRVQSMDIIEKRTLRKTGNPPREWTMSAWRYSTWATKTTT
jgi:hypothetical protein